MQEQTEGELLHALELGFNVARAPAVLRKRLAELLAGDGVGTSNGGRPNRSDAVLSQVETKLDRNDGAGLDLPDMQTPALDVSQGAGAAGRVQPLNGSAADTSRDRNSNTVAAATTTAPTLGSRRTKAAPRRAARSNTSAKMANRNPEWTALRARVRAVMNERHIDLAGLGAATGLAPSTAKCAVGRKVAPGRIVVERFKAFVDQQPAEVAATGAAPFRGAADGAAAATA